MRSVSWPRCTSSRVDDVYEARRILEVGAAGLAAERATPDHLATLADEVAGLFASLTERQVFLVHDINFHRSIAAASGNPIVASLVEMVSALYYERRRANGGARVGSRPARRGRLAPADLSGRPRARCRGRAPRDERASRCRSRRYQAKEDAGRRIRLRVRRRSETGVAMTSMATLFDLTGKHRRRRRRHERHRPRARARARRRRRRRRRDRTPRGDRGRGRRGDRGARPADAAASGGRRATSRRCARCATRVVAAFGKVDIVVAAAGDDQARRRRSRWTRPTGSGSSTPTSPACCALIRCSRRR